MKIQYFNFSQHCLSVIQIKVLKIEFGLARFQITLRQQWCKPLMTAYTCLLETLMYLLWWGIYHWCPVLTQQTLT